ncbi:hypothetical protein [Lactiplantibacillus plantarum]|uniref:hypothetical protein n=1 Tax=Lactiplantibacillus plantarum TaxID=1590 RepID=UPI000480B70F|nr:hypothetical protein [Lactiplantibacillus plantarum]
MAKTLSFTDTSPQTVKIGDTTTSFSLICGNDNVATDLTKVTSITVKLGNTSGYLKSATVDPASLTDPTTGQVTVNFNADLMTSLTAGSYSIEVWVVDSTGTSIYPSDGSTGFTITNNIQSTNGSVITTITFDDFVAAMNKAASTIAKGDKGDKGDPGTVDNLQIGVQNLIYDTSFEQGLWKTAFGNPSLEVTNDGNLKFSINNTEQNGVGAPLEPLEMLKQYTLTAKVRGHGPFMPYIMYNEIGNLSLYSDYGVTYPMIDSATEFVEIKYTFTLRSRDTTKQGGFMVLTAETVGNWLEIKKDSLKLEAGSVATDWCPNPSEVLTQSDYAKIKAAIVALGGTLS